MAALVELRIPLLVAQMGKILKHLILRRLQEAAAAKKVRTETLAGAVAVAALAMPEVVPVLLDRVLEEVLDGTVVMLVVAVEERVERGVMDVPQEERAEQDQVGVLAEVVVLVTTVQVAPPLMEEEADKAQA